MDISLNKTMFSTHYLQHMGNQSDNTMDLIGSIAAHQNTSDNPYDKADFHFPFPMTTPDLWERVYRMFTSPHDVIAILIGLVAIILNVLVVLALTQMRYRLTTHHLLIISLASSDIIVGASVVLHIINAVLNPVYFPGGPYLQYERLISACTSLTIKALNCVGLNMSLLNLMLMAIDHFMAVTKPLHAHAFIGKSKVICSVIILWIIAIMLGFSDFYSGVHIYHKNIQFGYNYCEVVRLTRYQEEYTVLCVAPLCLGVMMYLYGRIYMAIHMHQRPGEILEERPLSNKTSKALVTTLLNLGTFILTWLPVCLFQVIMLVRVHQDPNSVQRNMAVLYKVDKYLFDLLLLNALADSIIYAVRVKEVQMGLWKLCIRMSCCKKRFGDWDDRFRRQSIYRSSYRSTGTSALRNSQISEL